MLHIYICYSRQSQNIVKTLAQDFEALEHKVWFDQVLTGGQDWWHQILERIRECDLFVFALAPKAIDSYACKLELTYASNLRKLILPILVADGVSTNLLLPALQKIQILDYRHQDKQTAFTLFKALNNLPSQQQLPDPLPKCPEVPISYLGNLKDQIETTTLSFKEQTELVLKLKTHLHESDDLNDVLDLLRRLRKRDDLFAKVAQEIDALLTDNKITSPSLIADSTAGTTPQTLLTSDKSGLSKVLPHDIQPTTKEINIENATEEITEILQRVKDNKETWTLKSDPQIIMLASGEKTIIAQAVWEEWFGNRKKTLKTLGWDTKDTQGGINRAIEGFAAYMTLGLTLRNENTRKSIKAHKATCTWTKINSKSELTDIAKDIIQALKVIAPDSKTIITKKQ